MYMYILVRYHLLAVDFQLSSSFVFHLSYYITALNWVLNAYGVRTKLAIEIMPSIRQFSKHSLSHSSWYYLRTYTLTYIYICSDMEMLFQLSMETFGGSGVMWNGMESIATFAKPKNCGVFIRIHPRYQQLMVIIIIIRVFVCFSLPDAEAANIFGPKAFHGL